MEEIRGRPVHVVVPYNTNGHQLGTGAFSQ